MIASLARPGGNVTGVTQNTTETEGKRLEILHEIIPKATRVASLMWDKSLTKAGFAEQTQAAAKKMGVTLIHQEVGTPDVNLKAAKALGLTIPQAVLLRADEVIK